MTQLAERWVGFGTQNVPSGAAVTYSMVTASTAKITLTADTTLTITDAVAGLTGVIQLIPNGFNLTLANASFIRDQYDRNASVIECFVWRDRDNDLYVLPLSDTPSTFCLRAPNGGVWCYSSEDNTGRLVQTLTAIANAPASFQLVDSLGNPHTYSAENNTGRLLIS